MRKPWIPLPLALLQAAFCFLLLSWYSIITEEDRILIGCMALVFGVLLIYGLTLLPKNPP